MGIPQRDQHSSLVFPQNPPPHPPAHVTHRLRSCHRGQNTRARTPATADMSVMLHLNAHKHKLSPTHTHTHRLSFSCRPDRQSPSYLLPSDGSSGRTESARSSSLISRFHTVNTPLGPWKRQSFSCWGFLTPSAPRVTRLRGGWPSCLTWSAVRTHKVKLHWSSFGRSSHWTTAGPHPSMAASAMFHRPACLSGDWVLGYSDSRVY